jgi:hypothetical protein
LFSLMVSGLCVVLHAVSNELMVIKRKGFFLNRCWVTQNASSVPFVAFSAMNRVP